MAKSERKQLEHAVNSGSGTASDDFDVDALLKEDLSFLPEEQVLLGSWAVKWISAFINHGTSDKGEWTMITINFDPIHAFSEDREEIEAELDMEDLPRLRHRVFYTSNADKRAFVELVGKFGVEAAPLGEMLSEARGQLAVTAITRKKSNRGQLEARLGNFRVYPDEMPFGNSE